MEPFKRGDVVCYFPPDGEQSDSNMRGAIAIVQRLRRTEHPRYGGASYDVLLIKVRPYGDEHEKGTREYYNEPWFYGKNCKLIGHIDDF